MARKDLTKVMEKRFPDVDPGTLQEFLCRMDRDYFSCYSRTQIRTHIRMSGALAPDHPVQLKIAPRGRGRFDITIVAYDYFSEFSVICGLLTSFGFDILAGNIYTFSRTGPDRKQVSAHRPSPMKIVDVFRVHLRSGESFDASRQKEFERELETLILLLGEGRLEETRERLNRRLIEHLEKTKDLLTGLLYPVEVRFDNRLSPKWTVMDVRSKDAPVFLYAFSNALAMRNIYIHKVRIQSTGAEVRDQFYISDRQGRKIEGDRAQKPLRMAVALIKQFTRFLSWAPDPAKAIRYFDQLLDKIMEERTAGSVISLFRHKERLNLLARLLGTSDFLWEDFLRMQFENLLPILEDFKKRDPRPGKEAMQRELIRRLAKVSTREEKKKALNAFKDREMFLIDMKHLVEPQGTLVAFSQALTDLAEVVLDQAYGICHRYLMGKHGRPLLKNGARCPFSICGLGKFGGREMGYASDIELLFLYGGPGRTRGRHSIDNGDYFEQLAREIADFIEARQEGIFHIDLRLRPHGKAGPLANSIKQLMAYYHPDGEAAPFEQQALIKLRWIAGDESLGRRMEAHRDRFVYSGEPWDRMTALHLRRRQVRELVKPGKVNVKYSAGGIIDIEYAVQYLQMMHGHEHSELRNPNTLEALAQLFRLRIVSQDQHRDLREAYIFLRALIDALRMVRGNARDLVLPDSTSEEFKFLARRLGYRERDWAKGARKLAQEILRHMGNVHRFFVNRF